MVASVCLQPLLLALVINIWARSLYAQAPGDADFRCTDGHERPPVYPDNVRMLMDSNHYEALLPGNGTTLTTPREGAVWNDRSFEGNDVNDTDQPTYWQQGAGGICRIQTRVCGYRQPGTDQNNWLFTQHIRKDFNNSIYNYPVEVQVELVYRTVGCRERQTGCKEYFFLHDYITNTQRLPITVGTGFMNTDNYNQLVRVRPAVTSRVYNETFNFALQSSQTGFYIAIRDTGSCIAVSRLRVYRYNCPPFQTGLVLYPDAPAPASGSVDIPVQCVANSKAVTGSDTVTCRSDGTWGVETPQCVCDNGYEAVNSTEGRKMCTACGSGFFKSSGINKCSVCPPHSSSDIPAASICHCSRHHYRVDDKNPSKAPLEDATTPCTKAPSRPTNLTFSVTNTTVSVSWHPPHSDGGRPDVFYRVKLRPVLRLEDGVFEENVVVNGTPFSYTFDGLKPVTYYMVIVQAENGVSYEDDRVELRLEQLEISTAEGNPEPVLNPKAVDNVVLVWGPPTVPNGAITGYEIMLRFCNTEDDDPGSGVENETQLLSPESPGSEAVCETATHPVDATTLFFVLNNDVLPDYEHNLTYTIRAKTGEDRYGVWSEEITIVPKIVCPRLPPTTPPTTPPTCPTVVCNTTSDFMPTVKQTPAPSSESTSCGLDECVLSVAYAAGGVFLLTTLLCCLFSCSIACIWHKHKMKTYRIKMKKQMQSKWEY